MPCHKATVLSAVWSTIRMRSVGGAAVVGGGVAGAPACKGVAVEARSVRATVRGWLALFWMEKVALEGVSAVLLLGGGGTGTRGTRGVAGAEIGAEAMVAGGTVTDGLLTTGCVAVFVVVVLLLADFAAGSELRGSSSRSLPLLSLSFLLLRRRRLERETQVWFKTLNAKILGIEEKIHLTPLIVGLWFPVCSRCFLSMVNDLLYL